MRFSEEMVSAADELTGRGHDVRLPQNVDKYRSGEMSAAENFSEKIDDDLIRKYYRVIGGCDGILIVNPEKDGIDGYVGGNSLIEMAFAHVLDKKIFLLYRIPELSYADEIRAMQPIVLDGDFSMIS